MAEVPNAFKGNPLTHAWPYRDPQGATVGIVARYDGPGGHKDVVPHFKPNGSGWKPGGPQEPGPLFGLDLLAGDESRPALVVEGERCAAALHSLGLVAVTSPGGAAAAHRADWRPLSGRGRVFILPDNDTPGRHYAEAVAAQLASLEDPPEALLLDLPDLPERGDVVDWLQARCPGWDGFRPVPHEERERLAAELRRLASKARPVRPDWLPAPKPPAPLVPLDAFTAPPLNPALLPGSLGRYAAALAAATETPPELPVAMTLAALATATHGRFRIMVKPDYVEPLNLWLLCALPPGNRKSAVEDAAKAPLLEWEEAEADRLAPEILHMTEERRVAEAQADSLRKQAAKAKATAERSDLMRELRDLLADMPEVPRAPQLVTTDATPERLGMLLADNRERMGWLSSEGGVFDLLAGRYSGGIPNLDLMLKAHSGDHERVDRAGRPTVYLRRPALTIGLSPQPEVLRGLAQKPGFRGRGLLGRFLYLLPPSPVGFRTLEGPPVPGPVAREYAAMLGVILRRDEEIPALLRLSRGAFADWREFALTVEAAMRPGGEFEPITDWAGKLAGAAARLAGNLHVAAHAHGRPEAEDVSPETMGAALELAALFAQHALAVFDLMGADASTQAARQVWGWIEARRVAQFTARECWQGLKGRFARMAEVSEALAVLTERGYLDEDRPARAGPGRPPAPVYRVREELARGWV